MSIRYLDLSGAVNFWTNIKNYILSKIPTKTSELTNDSGFLTQHQSLSNYVTLNSNQTITAIKTITGGNQGKMIFKNPNFTLGTIPESATTVTRIYFGGGASYDGSTGAISNDIASNGNSQLEICALNNNSSNSYRTSLILRYEQDQTRPRFIKSWGDFCPYSDDTYYLGRSDSVWKECYCNAYYLGTTAFGDIVTHNASEFLTSHQSLSSCVKNSVVNSQTIKSTGIARGTAPSSAQTFGIAFVDNTNTKYIGNIYGQYATDKSTYVGLYAYKGTTTSNGDNAYLRVGYDASGNVYTSAPTPATSDNSTQIATTAFVKAQGYLTSHPNITLSSNTTSTASPAHGDTFTCIDSVTRDTNGHVTKVNTKTVTLPADSNTDTKVTQTATTANSYYPVLLCATANATETGTTTSRFSAGLTVNTRYSSIYMSNKYDTANTKGVRNTASYSNGILYFRSYDDTQMGLIRCDSHKSGYQHIYMQASNYIKNGAINPEGTATTCSIAVRVRDNGSKTIYTEGSWENSLTPYTNETYNIGTSSLRWMGCYCKNFYGSYVDIAGKYLENEFSTNARTCLYLKSNRDTDGKSGIYFSKYRQNRAQGSLTGSDLVSLTLDVLENSVRTNNCISIDFRYFENDVPTKIYVVPKASATSYMGTAGNPWTNAYITNLNLNGNAFDPTSTSGKVGDVVFASAYYSSLTGTIALDITVSGNDLYLAGFDNDTLIISSQVSLTGTWKFLGGGRAETTSGNASTKRTGLWKRIA